MCSELNSLSIGSYHVLKKLLGKKTTIWKKNDKMEEIDFSYHLVEPLTEEFDALLDRMQEPGVRPAMERAFSMTPEELGHAARRQGGVVASRHLRRTVASHVRKGKALPAGVGATMVRMRKPATAADVALTKRSAVKKTKHRTRG